MTIKKPYKHWVFENQISSKIIILLAIVCCTEFKKLDKIEREIVIKYSELSKVKVKSLTEGDYIGNELITERMAKFSGKIVTIKRCCEDFYMIKEDSRPYGYRWNDDMFKEEAYEI